MIVREKEPITLIGGAAVDDNRLKRAFGLAPHIIAADSGADSALELGFSPRAVIGDLDSISHKTRERIPPGNLHHIAEQDSTDFDKCLRHIYAPLIICVGFTGGCQGHQLAALNTLVRFPNQRCILLGERELVFLAPPSLRLELAAGTGLSLFPMGAVEGISDGLRWPIGGLNFAPDGRVGTSNEVTGNVHLSMTAPKMLVILPQDAVETVAAALLTTPSRWPEN